MSTWSQTLLNVGTTKTGPAVAVPPSGVTTTGPDVALVGTGATMLLLVQVEIFDPMLLKVAPPKTLPKLNPPIVTLVPELPLAGVRLLMNGPTMKLTPLLCKPPLLTTTLPLVAELGTAAVTLVSDQLVTV